MPAKRRYRATAASSPLLAARSDTQARSLECPVRRTRALEAVCARACAGGGALLAQAPAYYCPLNAASVEWRSAILPSPLRSALLRLVRLREAVRVSVAVVRVMH